MISPEPIVRILPVLGIEAERTKQGAGSFVAGNQYAGEILSRVDSHTFTVRINQALFNMQLGQGVEPGQSISLTYLNATPVPTFSYLAGIAQNERSEHIEISRTAGLIDLYLNHISETGVVHVDLPVNLLPAHPKAVAEKLQASIALSGLFYESHLADFTLGKRSIELIRQEPQNQEGFDTTHIVASQLDVHEQHIVRWSGQVWSGQAMDLAIGRDQYLPKKSRTKGDSEGQPSEQNTYTTTLVLELPNIGRVAVTMSIGDEQMSILIDTVSQDSEQLLKSNTHDLSIALKGCGLELNRMQVQVNEQQ